MDIKCPYLKQIDVCYCSAAPIKKYIPADTMARSHSPCSSNEYVECPVYRDSSELTPEEMDEVRKSQELQAVKNECVWINQEKISYRLCVKNYECNRCEFEQQLLEVNGRYVEPPGMQEQIKKLKTMPASERRCKYVLISGRVKKEPCLFKYECWRCSTYQRIRASAIEIKNLDRPYLGENHGERRNF